MPPFCHTRPVGFADVDHAGIVYYPVFFHYFHLVFEELFRQRMGPRAYADLLDRQRIGFPAVRCECDYKAPLRFGDLMDIEMSVARLGNRSMDLRYRVYRHESDNPEASSERLLAATRDGPIPGTDTGQGVGSPAAATRSARVLSAEGATVSAVVDLQSFRAVQVPAFVRELLAPLTV